jgi:hypothetical protein
VVNDPLLTLNEKRAILASWASDACAIEAVPSLRCLPEGTRPVLFDAILAFDIMPTDGVLPMGRPKVEEAKPRAVQAR